MTLPGPSDLNSEEQALAARLTRLGPHAEPSSALDARVLAAAHAAAKAPAGRPALRRRRWPAVLGLAASLVLAVGLAWRLRPQPQPAPAPRQEHVAVLRTVVPPAPSIAPPAESAAPSAPAEASRNASGTDQTSSAEEKPAAPAEPSQRPAEVEPPAAPAAKTVFDTPTPMSLPPPPPAPPQAPPDNALRARAAAAAAPPPAAPVVQDNAADTSEAEQADTSSGAREGDEPSDEVPPATVDSPVVRDAWLQRIQRLVDAGDIAGARASLREFERRYPDYALPEDLRALAR